MLPSLSSWTKYSAFLLSFMAGSINVIGLLDFEHQSVSHLSGTASMLSVHALQLAHEETIHLVGIIIAFVTGAVISGYLLHNKGKSENCDIYYQTALLIEALLILLSLYFLTQGSYSGHYSASAACGLQNSLTTSYSGSMIRTTHLTGTFTDIGIILGEVIRGNKQNQAKLTILSILVAGFISGGAFGTLLFSKFAYFSLLAPAAFCIIIAIGHRKLMISSAEYKTHQQTIFQNQSSSMIQSEAHLYSGLNQVHFKKRI